MKKNNQTLEETIALFQMQQEFSSTLNVGLPNEADVSEEEFAQAEQMKLKNDMLLQGVNGSILEMLDDA